MAVLLGVATFGYYLKDESVLMSMDNTSMQQAIRAGKSKDSDIMALIRAIYFYTSIKNITYDTVFIEGSSNVLADHLSRGKIREFKQLAPNSELFLTKPVDFILNF